MKKSESLFKNVTETVTVKKKVTKKEYNWGKIPTGSKFTAIISGGKYSGRILKEKGIIYLCQDFRNGNIPPSRNRLGYKYSWSIRNGISTHLKENSVSDLQIELDPKYTYVQPLDVDFTIKGYNVKTSDKDVKIGCTTVTFEQVEAIYSMMIYKSTLK